MPRSEFGVGIEGLEDEYNELVNAEEGETMKEFTGDLDNEESSSCLPENYPGFDNLIVAGVNNPLTEDEETIAEDVGIQTDGMHEYSSFEQNEEENYDMEGLEDFYCDVVYDEEVIPGEEVQPEVVSETNANNVESETTMSDSEYVPEDEDDDVEEELDPEDIAEQAEYLPEMKDFIDKTFDLTEMNPTIGGHQISKMKFICLKVKSGKP